MNSRYLEEDDDLDTGSADREISLSPSTLLGIFFLLAIICAIFFGFGYSMGHRSALAATQSEDSETAPLKASSETKPAPGLANSGVSADQAAARAAGGVAGLALPPFGHAARGRNAKAARARPILARTRNMSITYFPDGFRTIQVRDTLAAIIGTRHAALSQTFGDRAETRFESCPLGWS